MTRKLTPKQEIFISEYISNGFNATQAAKDAGYSQKTAMQIGEENLRKPVIAEQIDKKKAEIAKKNELTADVFLKNLEEARQMAKDEKQLSALVRAIELQGKYLKLLTDKIEHSGVIKTEPAEMSNDELEQQIRAIQETVSAEERTIKARSSSSKSDSVH